MNVITAVAETQAERDRKAGNVGLVSTIGYPHAFAVRAAPVEASRRPRA